MISNTQNSTPTGLYILSGLALLLILDILFVLFAIPSNWVEVISTIIFIPILIYVGIGIIKPWPKARDVYIVVAILLFAGTIIQIITQVAIRGEGLAFDMNAMRYIFGLTVPPVIYFYLHKSKVKSFFSRLPDQISQNTVQN